MMGDPPWRRLAAAAAVLWCAGATGATAATAGTAGTAGTGATAATGPITTGNLYGKVKDQNDVLLPGVTVTLEAGDEPQTQVSNRYGEFRFLGLAPGTYTIRAELQGFSPLAGSRVTINAGRNTTVEIALTTRLIDDFFPDAMPLLDERAVRIGITLKEDELQGIPTSRDPRAVLQSTPGVLVDRVDVGGNDSGQQPLFTGPGSFATQSVWSVDGAVITDMTAAGGTPAHFDFDSLDEMQVSTGGSDVTVATGGVAINLVTRRGLNEWRGSARYLQVPGSTQSATSLRASDIPAAQRAAVAGGSNRINEVQDDGAELGGPIVRDRLWLWGAYGDDKVSVQTLPSAAVPNGETDRTDMPTWNAKLNAQVTIEDSATLVAFNSARQETGRNAGPTRLAETTWDQGRFGGGPSLLEAEDTDILTHNLYLTALYSHVDGGYFLDPRSGLGPDVAPAFQDDAGVWHNSFIGQQSKRPQVQEKAEVTAFFNTGLRFSHTLLFGAAHRVATAVTGSDWPGGGLIFQDAVAPGVGEVALSRAAAAGIRQKYTSAYAQDTVTMDRLTANLGLRYDRQGGDNLSGDAAANLLEPDKLPAESLAGGPIGFTWGTWAPRLGLTYALGADRATLLRASYSRFADQLRTPIAAALNPLATVSYYYAATTYPGTGLLTAGQIRNIGLGYSAAAAPNGNLSVANRIASHFNAPLTDELLASAEHTLTPDLAVGLNLTYRLQHNLVQEDALVFDAGTPDVPGALGRVATRADFIPRTENAQLPNGQIVPVTWYVLRPGVTTHHGYFFHNGDYETTYKGASLTFRKRLSRRWMMRGNITYQDWYYNRAGDRPDPTEILGGGTTDGLYVQQGDPVVQGPGPGSGAFQNVYIDSRWQFGLDGMVQIAPDRWWGFDLAGNLTGRQGYPEPSWVESPAAGNTVSVPNLNLGPVETVQVGATDGNRLADVVDFDLRLEKELTFQDFGLTLSVDCFNLFNAAFVLQRLGQFNSTGVLSNGTAGFVARNAGFVNEVVSPRVFRFGARLTFR